MIINYNYILFYREEMDCRCRVCGLWFPSWYRLLNHIYILHEIDMYHILTIEEIFQNFSFHDELRAWNPRKEEIKEDEVFIKRIIYWTNREVIGKKRT